MRSISTEISSPTPSRKQSRSSFDLSSITKTRSSLLRSTEDFDIFDFFTKLKSAKLTIPETLIELSRSEIFFLSSVSNTLQIRVKNPGMKFFEFPQNPKNCPKYIHFAENDIQIFYSEKEAIRCWNSYRGTKHRMQRYVYPLNNLPQKLRAHWRANKATKSYLITNQNQFHQIQPKRFSVNQRHSSGHMHNLSQYPYAGQIFTSSFNSFLPYKASIPEQTNRNFLSPQPTQLNSKDFYSKLSNPEEHFEEVPIPEEVNSMIEEFVKIFKEKYETKDNKTLSEALLDFICEGKKWYLVKVKYFKLDYLPSKVIKNPLLSPQLLKKSVIDSEMLDKIFSSIGDHKKFKGTRLTQANLLQRLSKIENKGNLLRSSGMRYLDMQDIAQKNIENYKRFSPSVMVFPSFFAQDLARPIEDAVQKYEEFRKRLNS